MGCESDPGSGYSPFSLYKTTSKRCGKVFRYTFAEKNNVLSELDRDGLLTNIHLNSPFLKDVTREYFPTSDVHLRLKEDDSGWAFINVFSNGQWTPIFAGKIKKKEGWIPWEHKVSASFNSMARNVLYLVSSGQHEHAKFLSLPFWINSIGQIKTFNTNHNHLIHFELPEVQSHENDIIHSFRSTLTGTAFEEYQEKIYQNEIRSRPKKDSTYTLYYWENGWILGAKSKKGSSKLFFHNIPSGTIYKLSGNNNHIDRPFAIVGNAIKWF